MLAVNYTNLRDNMKSYMDKVTDDDEIMIVTRKDNKNAAVTRMNNNKPNMSVDVDTSKAENSVKKLVDNMTKSLKGITVDLGVHVPTAGGVNKSQWTNISIKAYSSGGFPEDGLFFANHGELVGKFSNGRTAVANNGQITEGIEEASYRGMIRALSEYRGGNTNVNVTLQGDAKKMFRTMQTEANNYTMQTGKPAFNF